MDQETQETVTISDADPGRPEFGATEWIKSGCWDESPADLNRWLAAGGKDAL